MLQSWVLLVLFVVLSAAGAGTGTANAAPPSDRDVALWVRRAMVDDPRVGGDVSVEADAGFVTLRGIVESPAARRFAVWEAEKIRGVRGVVDEIEVRPGLESDDVLATRVRKRIAGNTGLAGRGIEVEVSGGVARLSGAVSSPSEWAYAELLASEVPGMQGVRNDLVIEPPSTRSDSEIRADVSATLARDVFLEGLPIDVRVSDGVVSLSGRVGSAYESSRAARDARGVVNVRDVVNTLEVDLHELRGVRAKRPVPSDAELASAVHQELLEDLRIGVPIELKVSAHRGVVTLQGRVTTLHQRRLAERDARDVVGTVWVVDHLKVVAEDRPDAAIGDDVRAQIDGDWALHDAGIHVHVIGGVVTLTGRVDDRFRRGHAADLASRVPGVRAIENDLAVEPETVSDATVADRVRERLEADALTHWVADAVAVDVNAGVVTLRGRVDLFAEREEAGRVALRTRGVAGVENRLAVKDVDAPWSDPPKEDPTRAYGEGSEDLDFGMAWAAPVW